MIQTTENTQAEKLAQTEAECDELTRVTKAECEELAQATRDECKSMIAETERQVYMIKLQVQEQCDNVNAYMESMFLSIDNLAAACNKTREIAAAGFSQFPQEEQAESASDELEPDEAEQSETEQAEAGADAFRLNESEAAEVKEAEGEETGAELVSEREAAVTENPETISAPQYEDDYMNI